jgi:hypothetical protein
MVNKFEIILDECIQRVNKGEDLKNLLADYPEYSKELEPLLKTMLQTKEAYELEVSDEALRTGRTRFYDALDRKNKPFWSQLFVRRFAVAIALSFIIVAVGTYFGLKTLEIPSQNPVILVASPTADGNFVFLVSDEVNAIEDFSSLNVSISKVTLYQQDNSSKQVEFSPEIQQFDLTLLPGDLTQQLWRGNIPVGKYSEIVIDVSKVEGTLKSSGQTLEIKLPSNKLKVSKLFEVNQDNITSFIYDLTIVKAGNAKDGNKYLLKPQINQSGASHTPRSDQNSLNSNPKKQNSETTSEGILGITPLNLADGVKGKQYEATLKATNDDANYVWNILSGSLPDGLKLYNQTGVISGIPAERGKFEFTIKVLDEDNADRFGIRNYTLTIKNN